jgi:hypothetical protein
VFLNAFAAHSNNLKLAQRMYQARVLELKELILAEEARFKFVFFRHEILLSLCAHLVASSVAAEIEAILSFGLNLRMFNYWFVASQRDRGLRIRPHGRVRHELI